MQICKRKEPMTRQNGNRPGLAGRAGKKLRSRSGLSILFALLIFMICAVLGSVVLTAGTAAAGRMSSLAREEQRYASVTSAAGLLRDELKGNSTDPDNTRAKVKVIKTTQNITEENFHVTEDPSVQTLSGGLYTQTGKNEPSPTEATQYTAENVGSGGTGNCFFSTFLTEAVKELSEDSATDTYETTITITPSDNVSNSVRAVEADIKVYKSDFSLEIDIKNKTDATDSQVYTLQLKARAVKVVGNDTKVVTSDSGHTNVEKNDATGIETYDVTRTTTTTTTETTEITWTDVEIAKVRVS